MSIWNDDTYNSEDDFILPEPKRERKEQTPVEKKKGSQNSLGKRKSKTKKDVSASATHDNTTSLAPLPSSSTEFGDNIPLCSTQGN